MKIKFSLKLPSGHYSLEYHSSYYNQDQNKLIAVWKVNKSRGMGTMAITSGKAEKEIPIIGNPTIRNYLIGKTWGWGEEEEEQEEGCTLITEADVAVITNGFQKL